MNSLKFDLLIFIFLTGILKQVKDYIKQCSKCQEKLDRSRPISDTSEMLEELGLDLESGEESNESEDDLSNFTSPPATASKPAKKKPVSKHELVFVSGTCHSASTFIPITLAFVNFFLNH